MKRRKFFRGEVYYVDLGETEGSEQRGIRPCAIIQNDIGNRYSSTTIVSAITSQINKASLSVHQKVDNPNLSKDSIILLEQIRTVDKKRIKGYICSLSRKQMEKVDNALLISLGLA